MDPNKASNAPGSDKQTTGGPDEQATDYEKQAQELQKQLADAQRQLEKKEAESKRNIQRLQSSLTSQINQVRTEREHVEKDWRARFDEQKMASLSEEEALRYQNSRLSEQLQDQNSKLEQMQSAAQNAQQAAQYIRHFVAQGVDASKLNTAGSLQELYDSGNTALEDKRAEEMSQMERMQTQLKEYEEKLSKFDELNPDPSVLAERKGDLRPPNVANTGSGRSDQPRTMLEAQEAAKQYFGGNMPTEEQLFRAVETKRLPPHVLPGLESLPKE